MTRFRLECCIVLSLLAGCNTSTPVTNSAPTSTNETAAGPETSLVGSGPQVSPADRSASDQGPVSMPAPATTGGAPAGNPIDFGQADAASASGAEQLLPPASAAGPAPLTDSELNARPFMTLRESESDQPQDLVEHLQSVDAAIGDLVVAGSNNIVDKEVFVSAGIRLGKVKLDAGERLANAADASPEQRKAGVLAQLVALSHLSGIGDVDSAQQLETLARSLASSEDADLAHQSRVVLLGFELQSLQNGVDSNPNDLLTQINSMFEPGSQRDFPEFMMLQQAHYVLQQMGFHEAALQVRNIIATEYQSVDDPQLRGESWMFAARDSQSLSNYNLVSRSLGTPEFESSNLLQAARGLFDEFPTATTVEQLSTAIANIEYSGNLAASQQLASYVEQKLGELPSSVVTSSAQDFVDDHRARTGLIGQPFAPEGLLGFDGQTLEWDDYAGRLVLIDFWATWCVPCLNEIPNIRKIHEEFSDQGLTIVGVNMDDSLEAARTFVDQQQLPWRSFYFQDQLGFQSEAATRHGINMIPFIVLIGPDGNVARIHVRGQELRPAIQELLAR